MNPPTKQRGVKMNRTSFLGENRSAHHKTEQKRWITNPSKTSKKRGRTKGQTLVYKTLRRKLKIEKHGDRTKNRKDRHFQLHTWHLSCISCYRFAKLSQKFCEI